MSKQKRRTTNLPEGIFEIQTQADLSLEPNSHGNIHGDTPVVCVNVFWNGYDPGSGESGGIWISYAEGVSVSKAKVAALREAARLLRIVADDADKKAEAEEKK